MFNRPKFWAALLLITAFVAGIAVGGGTTAVLGDSKIMTQDARDGTSDRGREHRKSYSERLQEELTLSAAQRSSIDTIIQRRQVEMRNLWKEVGPRFDTLRSDIRSQVLDVLDESQQEKFRELIARSDKYREKRERDRKNHRK